MRMLCTRLILGLLALVSLPGADSAPLAATEQSASQTPVTITLVRWPFT
jgi:hypothetical protein